MNTLHSSNVSAVIHTRLHTPAVPSGHAEKSGAFAKGQGKGSAAGGRGCVGGTSHAAGRGGSAGRVRPQHIAAVEGLRGEARTGDGEYREEPGARQEGTSEAEFTAYVRERRASLYATAYHLTGDRFEAEDLLQSALFSTYRAWHRISDKAAVGGYLRRTMTNLHISAWRRRKLNEYPTEELPETAGDQDAMRGTELRTVLWQALARLPELQRTMLVLRYYEGRTDPEIAEILDISVGTVKSSIWRSLRRLRDDEVLSFGRDQEESFGELVA
ncbi:SigE family RNA polymerase sigma factor [Streptomyces ovatisporus]|uniref:SigE family RNA polymerase sigma factor n=1 Tax=Streptomyces ovatisporus TaxID=1128682 RepID=A0ABV8ZYJ6_9ACTN